MDCINPQSQSLFFKIPVELRLQIYDELLATIDLDQAFEVRLTDEIASSSSGDLFATLDFDQSFHVRLSAKIASVRRARHDLVTETSRLRRTCKKVNSETKDLIPYEKTALILDFDSPHTSLFNDFLSDPKLKLFMQRARKVQVVPYTKLRTYHGEPGVREARNIRHILEKMSRVGEVVVMLRCGIPYDVYEDFREIYIKRHTMLRSYEHRGNLHPWEVLAKELARRNQRRRIIFRKDCEHDVCGPTAKELAQYGQVELFNMEEEIRATEAGKPLRVNGYLRY